MPSWAPLTDEQLEARKIVGIGSETVTNTSSNALPHHYGPEQDESWSLEQYPSSLLFRVAEHLEQNDQPLLLRQ